MSKHTLGPVESLARLCLQSDRYRDDPEFRDAVDFVLGSPVYDAAPVLLDSAESTVEYIEQLCSVVNHYADDLGLGQKVRSEDFTEKLVIAIAKAKGER